MAFVSRDGEAVISAAGWSSCAECGEYAAMGEAAAHLNSCSKRAGGARRQFQVRDPNVEVWTENGFEKAIDVERRRQRELEDRRRLAR